MNDFKLELKAELNLEDRAEVEPLIDREVADFGTYLSQQRSDIPAAMGGGKLAPEPIHPLEAQIVKTYIIWKLRKEQQAHGS